MKKKNGLMYAAIALTAGVMMTSCSDNDLSGENAENETAEVVKPASDLNFVITAGDPETDLTGGVVMKLYSDLSKVRTNESVYADSLGANSVKSYDSFTQVSYNAESGKFTGYIYARGASDLGIGALKAGLRTYSIGSDKLVEAASPVYLSNFGNVGTFGSYSYAAQISSPVVEIVDANGNGQEIDLPWLDYAIDEVNPNTSNFVDLGNGKVAAVLNYSNRDSAVVAFADYTASGLNITKVIYDGRIGASIGAKRSVRYEQSGADDDGNLYVFCGSGISGDDTKVGALRINKGTEEFDANYKFDILSAADGYRFRAAYHISDDKFLLDFYLDKTAYGNMDNSGKYAIVDMSDQTLTWVSGCEYLDGSNNTASIGWGDGYDGYYYLPVATGTSFGGGETDNTFVPAIWRINASKGVAEQWMTFQNSDLLKAITIIK